MKSFLHRHLRLVHKYEQAASPPSFDGNYIADSSIMIDGIKIRKGTRILVKNQTKPPYSLPPSPIGPWLIAFLAALAVIIIYVGAALLGFKECP